MIKLIFLFTIFIFCPLVSAQEKPEFKPEITVGGVIYTGWQYNIDNADFISKLDTAAGVNPNSGFGYSPSKNQFETSKNSFYLDRAYLNIKASLTPQINARITPDIFSITDKDGKTQYSYQIKYAIVEYTPLKEENNMSLSFLIGIIPNLWTSSMDKYYGYRGVAKTFTDYSWTNSATVSGNNVSRATGTFFPTADLGLTARFVFPYKYAELNLSVLNGNGFRNQAFDNRFKDVMVAGFVNPLAKVIKEKSDAVEKSKLNRINGISEFTAGGFAYVGRLDKGEYGVVSGNQYSCNRFGGMASVRLNFDKAGSLKIGGEYSVQSNSVPSMVIGGDSTVTAGGFSAFLEFNPPVEDLNNKLFLTLRYDSYDPNSNKSGISAVGFNSNSGKQQLLIAGVFYKPASVLTFGLSYHRTMFEKDFAVNYDGTPLSSISRLYFNTILDF